MYPVMLDLTQRRCLVVGGGGVALRKVQGLVEEGATVNVVALSVVEPLRSMATRGQIGLEERAYQRREAADYSLVFAATDDRELNRRIFEDAEGAGVWVNVADDPELCSFHLPARVRRGSLQLAIASAGEAPFVVRRLRQVFDRRLGPEWSEWLDAAARFRTAVRRLALGRPEEEARYDSFFANTVDTEKLTARVPTSAEERAWLGAPAEDHRRPAPPPKASPEACRRTATALVSLVGAGPGCAGLLTVRGRARLLEADAVVYDRLAAAALPCELCAEVELHPVGKTAGTHPIPQEEINALLVRLAREGKRVVRLKGGDPYVFGRGGEEAEALNAEGIDFEVIPGVTSGIAAAAWMGVPVTHRRESVRLTLVTAHEAIKSDGPQVRWDLLAQDEHATLIGYMGLSALVRVVEELLEAGMAPSTPAAMVEQGTTAAQRQVVSTLAALPQAVSDAGLNPPALFIIGPTVAHAPRLDWHRRLPLAGQRLVVPARSVELIEVLEGAGADIVPLPVPVTPAARVAMGALPLSGCVVASAADVDLLHEERGGLGWESTTVSWCIGDEALLRAGERGWQGVVELGSGLECHELVQRLVASTRRSGS